MNEVMQIAQRTKCCHDPDCCVQGEIWGSAHWRQIAPVFCTYGYDVIAQIGWQRQVQQQMFVAIYSDLSDRICISETQVRALYHYRYLPLLACHERQQLGRLQEIAQQVGLLLTLGRTATLAGAGTFEWDDPALRLDERTNSSGFCQLLAADCRSGTARNSRVER